MCGFRCSHFVRLSRRLEGDREISGTLKEITRRQEISKAEIRKPLEYFLRQKYLMWQRDDVFYCVLI